MRPLLKWKVGEHGVLATYNPYNKAKAKLKSNFGEEPYYFCSYCDRSVPGITIDVEHILPKGISKYSHLEFTWKNFLLSCKSCNGVKLDADFRPSDCILPHKNNTVECFTFNKDGIISYNPLLAKKEKAKIKKTIKLLGLDIGLTHPKRKPQDDRFAARREAFNLAKRYLVLYKTKTILIDDIISNCKASGFWSVWMYIFRNQKKVRIALVNSHIGTYPDCLSKNIYRK
jgi:uncharacterized protein (TIGR02646 family)